MAEEVMVSIKLKYPKNFVAVGGDKISVSNNLKKKTVTVNKVTDKNGVDVTAKRLKGITE